ncbi:hypothetical protein SESBI_47080 [Sesbania bispinosa]|nr:hypothetical protein SESBI_47080 [Sesbania bispinosa]
MATAAAIRYGRLASYGARPPFWIWRPLRRRPLRATSDEFFRRRRCLRRDHHCLRQVLQQSSSFFFSSPRGSGSAAAPSFFLSSPRGYAAAPILLLLFSARAQQKHLLHKRKQVGSGEGQVGTSTNLSKRAKGVASRNKGKRVGVVEEAEASEDFSSEEDELVPNADFIHLDGEEAEGFLNEQHHRVEINYADIDDEEED